MVFMRFYVNGISIIGIRCYLQFPLPQYTMNEVQFPISRTMCKTEMSVHLKGDTKVLRKCAQMYSLCADCVNC